MGLDKSLFVEPFAASSFECCICLNISYPPITFPCTECHVYCTECVSAQQACPLCRESKGSKSLYSISGQCRRVFNSLVIKCPSKCEWENAISNLESHLGQCPEVVLNCNNAGCSFKCPRKEYSSHSSSCSFGSTLCSYCNGSVILNQLSTHNLICESFPITCPAGQNQCPNVPRSNLSLHLEKECLFSVITCPWSRYGCTYACERNYLISHESDPSASYSHFELVNKVFAAITPSSTSASSAVSSMPGSSSGCSSGSASSSSTPSSSSSSSPSPSPSPRASHSSRAQTISPSPSSSPSSASNRTIPPNLPPVHSTSPSLNDELITACIEGSVRRVQMLLNQGAQTTAVGHPQTPYAHCTPLYIAAAKGYEDIVRVLLHHNAPVNIQNHKGYTPLHAATLRGNPAIINKLLIFGADPNVRACEALNGKTALHLACNGATAEPLAVLLQHGASITMKTFDGDSPLDIANRSFSAGAIAIRRELHRQSPEPFRRK